MSCKTPEKEPLVLIRPRPAPRHWKSLEERGGAGASAANEFPGGLPAPGSAPSASDASRRDFLSVMGFSLAAAGAAACRAPTQHAIPLPVGSDQIVPGVPNIYATTCGACAASCGLLVKQRDGRPIKVDGNADSPLFGGGTCASGQASVLSLYDEERLRGPLLQGQPAEWSEIDRRVTEALEKSRAAGRKIVLLTGTVTSPTTRQIIAEWGERFPTFRHVTYDGVPAGALRAAAERSFGVPAVPHYAFDKARVIVGLEADFLGTWLSPVEFARQYAAGRKPEHASAGAGAHAQVQVGDPPLHLQVESGLSVTGSNADRRIAVAPSELGAVAVALLARVAKKAHVGGVADAPTSADPHELDDVAERLWKNRGRSLVVTGSQDVNVQVVVMALNALLENIGAPGKTVDVAQPSLQAQGDDVALGALVAEMNAGAVGTLIIHGPNPLYDHPEAARFRQGLRKVGLSVSLSGRRDETSVETHAICPDHHFLEAWGDAEPVTSYFSLAQPIIAPLFDTRAAGESLLRWIGAADPSYHARLRSHWRTAIFARQHEQQEGADFETLWDRTLERGFLHLPPAEAPAQPRFKGDFKAAAAAVLAARKQAGAGAPGEGRTELHFYESVAMRDGSAANNPWLQELPDPISKVTWGNYAALAPSLAAKLGVSQGDVLALETAAGKAELPAVIQPGQDAGTISVAVGYGRKQAGKVGDGVGANVFALAAVAEGRRAFGGVAARVVKTGRRAPVASTQTHFSMEGRPIVQETTLAALAHGHGHGKPAHGEGHAPPHGGGGGGAHEELPTLWAARLKGAHDWGMAIDVNACTGCSACVVSCQAENNVPVVGEDQVRRSRIMHWLRIDHYYTGSAENPGSVHQPMMCQHCANAPCETVCPVLATTTSSEGINQQTYNRCIGTRYCANNCPYKVRRFNWYNYTDNEAFDFNMTSPLGRMVLNPDVTVRSRGVMEKCSLCVQRVQLGKNTALKEKRKLADGDVQTACQQACPTGAIVFGDLMDPNSRVSKLLAGPRAYKVLDDLGTRPNVGYLKKVRTAEET